MITTERVKIDDLAERPHRIALGDIGGLADDIASNGIRTRPTVTDQLVIIGGERVIEALRMLGDQYVTVDIVDSLDDAVVLLIRSDEDQEKFFKPKSLLEKMRLADKLYALDEQAMKARKTEAVIRGRTNPGGRNTDRPPPTATVARIIGYSTSTFNRMRIVHRIAYGPAHQPPELRQFARYLFQEMENGHITASQARNRLGAEFGTKVGTKYGGVTEYLKRIDDPPEEQVEDPLAERLEAGRARLLSMHHKTRDKALNDTVARLDRLTDQLAGLILGVGSIVEGDYPIELLPLEKTDAARVKNGIRDAKRALTKLSRAITANERANQMESKS